VAQHDQPTIHVRLPRPLHDQLREAAEREGLSLNTLVVALLAGGIGFKLATPKKKGSRRANGRARDHQSEGS
jgi:hypothetical protein